MLHGCGWAYVSLKEDKVLVAETGDDAGQPGLHCTITDLGSAIQAGKLTHCQADSVSRSAYMVMLP